MLMCPLFLCKRRVPLLTLGDLVVFLKGDRTHLDRTIDGAEKKVQGVASGWAQQLQQSFSFAIGGVIERSLTSIAAGIQNIGKSMVGGNAEFERYQTQFGVLLGNADLAQQRLAELADFGQRTPFELPELVRADKILQSFGLQAPAVTEHFKQMGIDIKTITGDLAAGTGASFEEIATNIGRFSAGATGEALQRFAELGIVTRSELAAMGVEFSKSGELVSPLGEAMDVLLQIAQQKFGGMMEAQSQTFEGMLSNLWDWVGQTQRALGEPIFDAFKTGLEGLLGLVQPGSPINQAVAEFAETIRRAIEVAGALLQTIVGGGLGGAIEGWATAITEKLQGVNDFLRQLKDEILGLTAGDIMGELGPGLASLNDQMNKSLADLEKRHNQTISGLQNQLANAGEKLASDLAAINEKYADKIADFQQRLADTSEQFNERLSDQAEQHAKRQANFQKQSLKIQGDLEEKLTDLKKDHVRRRQQLTTSLLTASSEEEYLNIKEQLRAEDEKYNEQKDKAKSATGEQLAELRDRMAEEDAEYRKQDARLKKQRDKALSEIQDQLSKVQAEKAKEVAVVQKAYQQQVAELQAKIKAENDAYTQQQEDIKAMYAQKMADFQAEVEARAAAVGKGPAAEVAEWIRWLVDGFGQVSAAVSNFITTYAEPLKAVLIGIGAAIVAGGVVAAITAIGAALAGISLPIVAIVAGVAGLYLAWTQNWLGIQEITASVVAWMNANLVPMWANLVAGATAFWTTLVTLWTQYGPQVTALLTAWWEATVAFWTMVFTTISSIVQTGLNTMQAFWQQHGDYITTIFSLAWANIQTVLSAALTIMTAAFTAFTAATQGNWTVFNDQIQIIWTTMWETLGTVLARNAEAIGATLAEMAETILHAFDGIDLYAVGQNIVDGLMAGLQAKWGEVTAWLSEQATNLPDWLNDPLGANSPAKKLMPTGASIVQGVQAGAEGQMGNLRKSLGQAMESLIPATPTTGSLAGLSTNYISLTQTNHMPTAPNGFDRKGLMDEVNQNTLRLFAKVYKGEG